jgi:hypothetical protein
VWAKLQPINQRGRKLLIRWKGKQTAAAKIYEHWKSGDAAEFLLLLL